MKIKKEECIGCEACHSYCTVEAISTVDWEGKSISEISQENCVECGVCLKSGICPTDAIYMPKLEWPRSVRAQFSDPRSPHPRHPGHAGRGTHEMKTNDVTGRYRRGFAGIALEIGRPGIGASFRDIQTICMALAELGIEFEQRNPSTDFIVDKKLGKIDERLLDEKVLSMIIEFSIKNERLKEVLEKIKDVSKQIDTVFSLDLISRVNEDGSIPVVPIAKEVGFAPRPNTKTNVGLGRPLKEEV